MEEPLIIAITQKEYTKLTKRDAWLGCLEQAGVDNWEGFSDAQELWKEFYDSE